MNKIYFSIPDFWAKHDLNVLLMQLYLNEREKFFDDIIIDSIYGNFPCIWNGGRYLRGNPAGLEMYDIIKEFNNFGLSIRFTCTNTLLKEPQLQDTIGNQILSLGEYPINSKIKNGVNCGNELMNNYVKEKYPNYYTIWSTTIGITNINEINKKSQDQLLVLERTISKDFDLLEKIIHKENIELLCCERCRCTPEIRQAHYENLHRAILGELVPDFICPYFQQGQKEYYYPTINDNPGNISIKEIREKYLPMGFNKFKISGRNESIINLIERYINYLIKDEYRDHVRNYFLLNTIMEG